MNSLRPFFQKIAIIGFTSAIFTVTHPVTADTHIESLMSEALKSYDSGNYKNAFKNWKKASETGNTVATVALANMYVQGEGRPKNVRLAAKLYLEAAEKGDPVGQLNYGDFLARGIGIPKNSIQAYGWLKLAGDQGNPWAQEQAERLVSSFSPQQRAAASKAYLMTKNSLK